MQYCLKNMLKPYTIYNGSKLMLLEVPEIKLKVIDRHNFVQAPLSAFPKTFGLSELKKGFFPHLFNTAENENYVGSIPDKKFYCYDTMNASVRKEFIKWHNDRVTENYNFDMQKELYQYCNSDVDSFDENTNTVYQYHGCFWHGCPKCYDEDNINTVSKLSFSDLYQRTVDRSNKIKNSGYNLIEMWECQWVKSKDYQKVPKFEIVEIKPT